MSPWYPPRVWRRGAGGSGAGAHDTQDRVDLLEGQVLVGLARGDDEVRRELHLTEQVLVLQRDVELVVHALSPQLLARVAASHSPEAAFPSEQNLTHGPVPARTFHELSPSRYRR